MAHEVEPMTHDETPIQELTRQECLELLQYHSFVGRVALVVGGHPVVLPVNYLADEKSVLFCTAQGTTLDAAEGAAVAFEVDQSHPLEHSGWSVLVRGTASPVTDAEEVEVLRRGPLRTWARRAPERWVRIAIEEISGRRLHGG
jgi:nitroimidazol reductase NimA-like FMN-containing flavoprotein (pyridoxamine 5'-phosphate oxidase superfamily)